MASWKTYCVMVAVFLLTACYSSGIMVKRSQMLMGTLVWVSAVAPYESDAQKAAAAGLAEIRRIEQVLSTWIPESELSRVNAAAGRKSITVSQETIQILERSLEMNRLTEGNFNIAIGPAVEAWNVSGEGRIPSQQELDEVRPLTNLANLHINRTAQTVYLAVSGMRVDIGGIGKGYAADLATEVMQKAGATGGVVAISGDIKTFGQMQEGKRFQFGIQHPGKPPGHLLARLELENEAVSTAGDYERFFERDGVRYHHILDPQTLQPARLSQSVTIVATKGVVADGLDTGIFVMGPDKGMALIESLPGVEGVIVGQDGTVFVSSGLENRLMMEPSSKVHPQSSNSFVF